MVAPQQPVLRAQLAYVYRAFRRWEGTTPAAFRARK
jgi:hypothetical protein